MIEIKEYINEYAEAMSNIIIKNLLEVNSKDYGMEHVQKSAKEFTISEIQNNFPKRTKVFVALKNDTVVGTALLDKSWYNDDGKYWILTVFVDIAHHKQGIEKYAQKINAKKLVIPASIAGCEFYHKIGHEYKDGKKETNDDQIVYYGKIFIAEKQLQCNEVAFLPLYIYFSFYYFTCKISIM